MAPALLQDPLQAPLLAQPQLHPTRMETHAQLVTTAIATGVTADGAGHQTTQPNGTRPKLHADATSEVPC